MDKTIPKNENKILSLKEKIFIDLDDFCRAWSIENNADLYTMPLNSFEYCLGEFSENNLIGSAFLYAPNQRNAGRPALNHDNICLLFSVYEKIHLKYNKIFKIAGFCAWLHISVSTLQAWDKRGLKFVEPDAVPACARTYSNNNNIYSANSVYSDNSSIYTVYSGDTVNSDGIVFNTDSISLYKYIITRAHESADNKLTDSPIGLMAHVNAFYNYDNKGNRQIALLQAENSETAQTLDEIKARYAALPDNNTTQKLPFTDLPGDDL